MPLDELRRTFLSEAADMLRSIDALIARQAKEPDNAALGEAIRRSLHTVKGTCGFLGLPRLESLAHALEECLTPDGRYHASAEQALIRAALDRMNRIIGRVDGKSGIEPAGTDGEILTALEEIGGRATQDLAGLAASRARMSWDGEPDGQTPAPAVETYRMLTARVPDEHVRKTLSRLAEIAGRQPAETASSGMQPIGEVWPLLARAAGELAAAAGKQVYFSTEGGDIVVDREVAQRLFQPLLQLVRNAIAHGIETPEARQAAGKPVAGRIRLVARQIGSRLIVEIVDDGAGVEPTLWEAIFAPGFTTQAGASRLAGRGIGLDIVRNGITEIDGLISLKSELGKGAAFTLDVPISLSAERRLAPRRSAAPAIAGERLAAGAQA